MFNNYFKSALNNLLKNRLYSVINIAGLSIGLAACLLIILYVHNETSYDKHWKNADRIFRITTTLDRTGADPNTIPVNSMLLLPALRNYLGEEVIQAGSQSFSSTVEGVMEGGQTLNQAVLNVEKEFLDIFELDVVSGDLEATLEDPGSIALSTETAVRFFGREDVTGQLLTIRVNDADVDIRVGAVYREPEDNTILRMPALRKLDPKAIFGGWQGPFNSTDFILLKEGIDPERINARFSEFSDTHVDIGFLNAGPDVRPSERYGFQLQNIRDIYLHSPFEGTSGNRGDTTTVFAFSAIAVLVLLIGCINFTVLSTSRATQRAREVAMRKTVGAGKSQLILQFLGESLLIVFLAICLSLALMELLLPVFEALVGKELHVSYSSGNIYLSMVFLWLTVSVIGGLYPAFVLSRFRPSAILKAGHSASPPGSIGLRNSLVVFQFGISIALIIATAVIYAQVQYAVQRDPGYNRKNLLVIESLQYRNRVISDNRENLKQQVSALPNVVNASLSGHQPMQRWGNSTHYFPFTLAGSGANEIPMAMVMIDQDFFQTYQIPFIAGRDFDDGRDRRPEFSLFRPLSDQEGRGQVIINASAAESLGFTDPGEAVGRQITTHNYSDSPLNLSIVGVVADTQFFTLRTEGRGEIYVLDPGMAEVLTVRYQGSPQTLLDDVDNIWHSMMGDPALQFSFVDRNLAREFSREQIEAQMLISFSLLAIIIACLGLYGSASFTVDRRTKEIGIRKVMGAEVREIVTMLMWQFSRPVLLANVIAWPTALWVMLTWLQRFPYRIDTVVMIPICVLAGFLALSIAWLTVAGNTVRVATTNPVYALRYE